MSAFQDLTGQRFGRLTVISRVANKGKRVAWKCLCNCGNLTEVFAVNLTMKRTKSCHNHDLWKRNRKIYSIWSNIKQRCHNPKNKRYYMYGARGITVCERWTYDFAAFLSDMGPRPGPEFSIDRIDNNKGYSPDNCRWVTPKEQSRNRKNNRIITFNGKTQHFKDWAADIGISHSALRERLRRGWPIEKALTTPRDPNFRQNVG